MDYPLHIYRGTPSDRPAVLVGHANGFPPELYGPLIDALDIGAYAVCLPARPLWNAADPQQFAGWQMMAQDFLAGMARHKLAPVIAIGHSMGGTALAMAAAHQPEAFRGLILIDPVFLPRSFLRIKRILRALHLDRDGKLVRGALRRRREWESVEEAYQQFRKRSLFRRCSDEMVRLYAQSVTRPNGQGVTLSYSPEWEAQIYRSVPVDAWRYPSQLKVPVLIVRGEETDTFLPAAAALWRKLRPDVPVVEVPEVGHLLPFENPVQVAEQLKSFIAKWS